MSRWRYASMVLAVLAVMVSVACTARAEIISGIMASNVDAGLGDAYGWYGESTQKSFLYKTVAIGEPLRVFYQIDDDDDEVTDAEIQIYLQEASSEKYFRIHTVPSVGQGKHYTVVKKWNLPAGYATGDYNVYIAATVIAPASEKGYYEWEYSGTVKIVSEKEWNILNFIGADNSLHSEALGDLKEMSDNTGTSDAVNVLALVDFSGASSTHLIRLHKTDQPLKFGFKMSSKFLPFGGELQSSDSKEVENFARWAKEHHPAKKWMLTMWDHGLGWRSFNEDKTPAGKSMHLFEFKATLSKINTLIGGKLKVLGFDECLMAMLEVAYEFRSYAESMIASQKTEGGKGWFHSGYQDYIVAHPGVSNGSAIAGKIASSAATSSAIKTLSAIRMDRIGALANAVGALGQTLMNESDKFPVHLMKAREKSIHVEDDLRSYIDLMDYTKQLKAELGNKSPAITRAVEQVEIKFRQALIWSKAANNRFKGLSIYYPYNIFKKWYATGRNDFYPSPKQAKADNNNKIRRKDAATAWYKLSLDLFTYSNHSAGNWGTLFATAGKPGSKWLKWITTDIVPPVVKEVQITQEQDSGTVIIHKSDTSLRQSDTAKSGEIKIKLLFPEVMDASKNPVITFGKEKPFDSFVFITASGWSKTTRDNDTWEGKFEIPPVPELYNGSHTLKINAWDKAGNAIDTNWNKDKLQPDDGRTFDIEVKGIPYLKEFSLNQDGKRVYFARWTTTKEGRSFSKEDDHKLNLSEDAGAANLTLSFSSDMDEESIKLSLSGREFQLVKKSDFEFEANISDLTAFMHTGSSKLPVIVEAQDVEGNSLDADPRTFATKNDAGDWQGYEIEKAVESGDAVGGPDHWHTIKIDNASAIISGEISSADGSVLSGAAASVEIEGATYSGKSGSDGIYQIEIPKDVQLPDSVFVMAAKEGFNTASKTVSRKEFDKADFSLSASSKYLVQIDQSLHHLGNGDFGGSINSQFQHASAEATRFEKSFELDEEQLPPYIVGASLLLSIKGAQENNPVSINGKNIGVVNSSNGDGSASVTTLDFDICTIKSGRNTFAIASTDSNANSDIDDFEFTNVQLHLTPMEELSKLDGKQLAKITSVTATARNFTQPLSSVDPDGHFWIKAKGKSRCADTKGIGRAEVYIKGATESDRAITMLLETAPGSSEFRSTQAVSVASLGAVVGQTIVIKAGMRGANIKVKDPNAEKLKALKEKLSIVTAAKDEWFSLRVQWKRLSDYINEQREAGNAVDDLMRNLRPITARIQVVRARYVELKNKHGSIKSLQAEIKKLDPSYVPPSQASKPTKAKSPASTSKTQGKKTAKATSGVSQGKQSPQNPKTQGATSSTSKPQAQAKPQVAVKPERWDAYKLKVSPRGARLPDIDVVKIAFNKTATRTQMRIRQYPVSLLRDEKTGVTLWKVNWSGGEIMDEASANDASGMAALTSKARRLRQGTVNRAAIAKLIKQELGNNARPLQR